MENAFDTMRTALSEARAALGAADHYARQMAWLLDGRLRQVDANTLKNLKRQLRDFNIHTGDWKP